MITERTSLRDYQRSLAARLAEQASRQTVSKLGVRAAGTDWLVDLADTSEVVPVPPITVVPLTQPWFAGIANVRGNLYSVVNFSAFLGEAHSAVDSASRLLLVADEYRINCALLVQAVLGLYREEELTVVEVASETSWVSARYTDLRGSNWKQLDMNRLVTHQDFLQVGL
jgi:twitching motility protein PilI